MKTFKKILLSILFCALIYFIVNYHSEKKKYQIVNEIFEDINFKPKRICHSAIVIELNNDIFQGSSFFDKLSVYSQAWVQILKRNANFGNEIQAKRLSYKNEFGKPVFSDVLLDCSTESEKKSEGNKIVGEMKSLNGISLPILSSDNKTAVMAIDMYCGGLCGEGYIYIFKKDNGKWKVAKKIMRWIS